MRCLYCGEPLSLLRKLTGKAEFCSEAHREAYQEEFNSLALQRLASQPKHSRRPEPLAPTPAAFTGLPQPEPQEEELELPVFDSPIFTGIQDSAPEVIDVPPPAPLWVFLGSPSPQVRGAIPAGYPFAVHLANYPRDCMMMAERTSPPLAFIFPQGGYAGLPEPQDYPTRPLPITAAPLACLLTALSLPASNFPAAEPSPESGHFLAQGVPSAGSLESHLVSPAYPVPPPSHRVPDLPELAQPSIKSATRSGILAPPAQADAQTPVSSAASLAPAPQTCDWPAALAVPVSVYAASNLALPATACSAILPCSPQLPDSHPPAMGLETHPESLVTQRRPLVPYSSFAGPSAEVTGAGFRLLWKLEPASNLKRDLVPDILATHPPVERPQPAFITQRESVVPAADFIPAPPTSSDLSFSAQSVRTNCLPWAASPAPPHLPRAFAAAASSSAPASAGYLLPDAFRSPGPASVCDSAAWATFPTPLVAVSVLPVAPVGPSSWPVSAGLAFLSPEVLAAQLTNEAVPHTVRDREPQPAAWNAVSLPAVSLPSPRPQPSSGLAKIRVKDFAWPYFAAGCDSLFTPDQPFRFHEMQFPHRGTSDMIVGSAVSGDMMEGLCLAFSDDRFNFILRPELTDSAMEAWMNQNSQDPAPWPSPATPASATTGPQPVPAAPVATEQRKTIEPPGSWQQAARAMQEGQHQVHRESAQAPAPPPPPEKPPVPEAKPVNAVPVIAEPMKGNEVARFTAPEPPIPFVPHEPLNNRDRTQPPASDGPGFEWRREQPHPAPPPPPPGTSSVSVNTTIIVEGNAGSGIVVENAVRISLGDRGNKKKADAVERFADGDDLASHPIQMAPPEPLSDFVAVPPELRAVLETIASLSDSIQWPKFSVTPMRRRIAFGPAKGGIFGSSPGHAASKATPETKTPLPPKKSVGGFLFKKLTNS